MRISSFVANIAALALLSQPAAANVWVFGDSNVDSGWYRAVPFSGISKFDLYLAMSSTYGIGAPTNSPGPMSVEQFAAQLGMTAAPANQGGTNFATSGAKNVNVNTSLNGGFPNAVPTATQISNFLAGYTHVNNDIFIIDSGGNDISFALGPLSGFDGPQQTAYIESQATALAGAIQSLQLRGGATRIIVVGQPESFGGANFQAARQDYDTTLKNALAALQVPYAWGDKDQVRKDIVANPGTFGIVHITTAAGETACPPPNPALNITTAWALLCSASSPVTQPTAFADQALFADDQHWSAAGQKVLGNYYYCLAEFTWPPRRPPRPVVLPGPDLPALCFDFTQFKRLLGPPPPPR